ncbi:hypothetical protein ACXR6G_05930 [Ancylomarina sp. YFZ004]
MKTIYPILIILILLLGCKVTSKAQEKLKTNEICEQELYLQQSNLFSIDRINQDIQTVQNGDLNNIETIQLGTDNTILSLQNGDENTIRISQEGVGNLTQISQEGSLTNLQAFQAGSENAIYLQQTGMALFANILQFGRENSVGTKDAPLIQDASSMMLLDIRINQDGIGNNINLGEMSSTIPKGIEITQQGNGLKLNISHITVPIPNF